jgi:hypothetical protein
MPISRILFNESPRENIFAIKITEAEFFKPPTEGKYKIIGHKTPRGYEKQLIPQLDRDDLEPDESIFSTPTSGMRHRKPVDGVFWYTKYVHYTLVWICLWN